jgi:Lrp/AsnC family transcriptional regulator, leucine-responsive regulatory protein
MDKQSNPHKLDAFDLKLLDLVQQDNLQPVEALSEIVHLSPSAVARRLRRLREVGAIEADVAVLASWVGFPQIVALINIQLERHARSEDLDVLRRHLVEAPEVKMAAEVSGIHDIVALVSVDSMSAFNQFTDRMLHNNNAIVRRYETSFVKRQWKFTTAQNLKSALADNAPQ